MKKIQDKIETYKRQKAIQKITKGLGKITEDETTIYCHVDEKTFKKNCDYGNIYGFNLTHHPVTIYNHIFPSLYGETYFLDKDIVYIFDSITFDKPLTFYISLKKYTHNYIKFQNCTFTSIISIGEAENVEFMNNRSNTYKISLYTRGTESVKNIKFVNDYTLSGFANSTFIDINCETLEMYNTTFRSDGPSVKAKNLIMNNSHIYSGETIEVDTDTIELTDSDIYSSNEIKLNSRNCNDFSNFKAFDIIYNGISLRKHNNSYEEIDKLLEARQQLVDTLATIKVAEENYQREEVSKYRKKLKNSPLTRRLKK